MKKLSSQTKKNIKIYLTDLLFYIIGSFIYSMGVYTFAKMYNFTIGGVAGIALILNHLWDLPIGLFTLILNIPLILISLKVVGKEFLIKTMVAIGISAVFTDIVFPLTPAYSGEPLLAALFSGLGIGSGMAFFYLRGASSGGMDFLIMTIKVKHPHFSFGVVTMATDFVVIMLGWPIFGDVNAVLYGLVCSFTTSLVMDKILYGFGAGKLLIIITEKSRAIADAISKRADRGSTVIKAIGSYTQMEKDVILCACSKAQAYSITKMVHEIDPKAFAMITETSEVYGEGFIEKDDNQL